MRTWWATAIALFLLTAGGANFIAAETSSPTAGMTMTAEEDEVFRLSNEYRLKAGLAPCKPCWPLVIAARSHCKEMLELGFFDHVSPTPGRTMPWDRVALAGFRTARVAENLYSSEDNPVSAAPKDAVGTWMRSSGHRKNILDSGNVNMGVGVSIRATTIYVTQVFAGPPLDSVETD